MTTAGQPSGAPAPLPLRALRISLILGAIVDLSGALPLLFFPQATARWLGVPVEGVQDFWPTYASVFLFVLPMVYLVTALNPARMLGMMAVAIAGRMMGALAYGYWWFALGKPMAFLGLALMNLGFAIYYFLLLGPSGRAELRAALHPVKL